MGMNRRNFKEDKLRVDKFEPQIKAICGQVFIKTAPKKVDCEEAADLIVLEINPIRIACRVRYNEFLENYGDEFTIRSDRPSGVKTELEKILEGWCDYNFYAFADKTDTYIKQWIIGNLNIFRVEYTALMWANKIQTRVTWDGTKFESFKINDLSDKFLYRCGCRKLVVPEVSIYHPINNPIYERFGELNKNTKRHRRFEL